MKNQDILNLTQLLTDQDKIYKILNLKTPTPQDCQSSLLWVIGEIGEVADILKKNNQKDLLNQGPIRDHLLEETSDVIMQLARFLKSLNITAQELTSTYNKKLKLVKKRSAKRWDKNNYK